MKDEKYKRSFGNPYEDLFIYMLEGVVSESDEQDFGNGFLGNWIEDNSSFMFFREPSERLVSRLVNTRPNLKLLEEYHFTYEEWQGVSTEPLKMDNMVIAAPWVDVELSAGEKKILLDPGVVFGSGLHPTTKDCLKALSDLRRTCEFDRVLDLGTGTGILALAAASLGAREVLAVDLNPLCVRTARRNVTLNGLEEMVSVAQGKAEDFVDYEADLVLANLHHEVIKNLLSMKVFKRRRWLILSGLMRTQARELKAGLEQHHLEMIREWDHEMTWYTVLLQCKFL
jgi:ribosomal protein L11 methyltransferase